MDGSIKTILLHHVHGLCGREHDVLLLHRALCGELSCKSYGCVLLSSHDKGRIS